jgi:hypothetical protein
MHRHISFENILFHHLKHHRASVLALIAQPLSQEEQLQALLTFGASQFDLYIGSLSVHEIISQVKAILDARGVGSKQAYKSWIQHGGGFRTIEIADGSSWTLRFVDHPSFIHLHPSRYSPHTIRIKANAMKTVACYLMLHSAKNQALDISMLNRLRSSQLGLSPVHEKSGMEEIRKVYDLLTSAADSGI